MQVQQNDELRAVGSVTELSRGRREGTNLNDDIGDDRSQGNANEIFILLPPVRDIRGERQELEPVQIFSRRLSD